jgi:hypothetical protein
MREEKRLEVEMELLVELAWAVLGAVGLTSLSKVSESEEVLLTVSLV